jgi:hypothetical protein
MAGSSRPSKTWPPPSCSKPSSSASATQADSLLFCETVDAPGAREALADIDALTRHLAESERWTEERARGLADDVAACGPVTQLV